MNFESSHEAAERLHVNVRTIQKWAKNGKIPGAKQMGKTWMIPKNFTMSNLRIVKAVQVMPLMNSRFSLGDCLNYMESISDEVEKALAYGEYYYFSGQPGKTVSQVESYLHHPDLGVALSAGVLYTFAALSLGEFGQKLHGMEDNLKDINRRVMAISKTKELGDYASIAAIFHDAITIMMHLPVELEKEQKKERKYLPAGLKLYGAYTYAHQLYLHHNYNQALGVAETALLMIEDTHPIPEIYLHLIMAMTLLELRRTEEAKAAFLEAWNLAKKDNFVEPFAEHYAFLHGLAEICLKRMDEAGLQSIIQATSRFNRGWTVYHETASRKVLTDALTPTEMTVAMIYTKGWRIKEIAAHMELSERMVKHHIAVIYEKLGVSSRDELREYVPNQ